MRMNIVNLQFLTMCVNLWVLSCFSRRVKTWCLTGVYLLVCLLQACYGIQSIPEGTWLCRTCALGVKPSCMLCPKVGGAMKSTRYSWTSVSLEVCCSCWKAPPPPPPPMIKFCRLCLKVAGAMKRTWFSMTSLLLRLGSRVLFLEQSILLGLEVPQNTSHSPHYTQNQITTLKIWFCCS